MAINAALKYVLFVRGQVPILQIEVQHWNKVAKTVRSHMKLLKYLTEAAAEVDLEVLSNDQTFPFALEDWQRALCVSGGSHKLGS